MPITCEKSIFWLYWLRYCLNNPLVYTDPTGEKWWHFLPGGLVAGAWKEAVYDNMGTNDWHNVGETASFMFNPFKGAAWMGSLVDAIDYGDISEMDPFKPGTKINNSDKLFGGLFAADTEQSGWGWQILSRLTFQQPVKFLGLLYGNYLNQTGRVDVEYFHGATVIYDYDYGNGGAISIGGYIAMDRFEYAGGRQTNIRHVSDYGNDLLMHEYGHFLQLRHWGGIAFPSGAAFSILSAGLDWRSVDIHDDIWVERDANARSWAYFGDRMHGDALREFTTGDRSSRRYYDGRFLRSYLFPVFGFNLIYDRIWSD